MGPLAGQQGHGGRRQRQTNERRLGVCKTRQHEPERKRRLLPALQHVDMRVGPVANDDVAILHHSVGDVGVQIERDDDARRIADGLAGERDDIAIGIVAIGGDHGTVIGDVDRVEFAGCPQAGLHLVEKALVQLGFDRAMGMACSQQQGNWLPGSGRIHGAHEGGRLPHDPRVFRAGVREDILAAHDVGTGEITLTGWRGLPVALQSHSDDGYARNFHGAPPAALQASKQ